MNYMKHIIISLLTLTVVATTGGVAYAHLQAQLLTSPGLTPSSPFYFLDRFGEFIQEFFTFNPEGKVRLQVEFAAERVAEAKLTLETQGAKSEALETALTDFQENISKAAGILAEEKDSGKDVIDLTEEIQNGFDEQKDLLSEVFNEHKDSLKTKEDELKDKIDKLNEDDTAIAGLLEELDQITEESDLLEVTSVEQDEKFDSESERFKEVLESEDELDLNASVDLEKELKDIEKAEKESEKEINNEAAGKTE